MSQIPAARQGELNAVPSDRLRSAAEAVLVVADEPITAASLSESLGLDENATEKLLESLAAEYAGHEGQGRPRGFILRRVAGGWRLASAPEFSDIVERFVIGGATATTLTCGPECYPQQGVSCGFNIGVRHHQTMIFGCT